MDPQARALELYFRSAVQNLEAASRAVVLSRAQKLKSQTQADIKANFRRRIGGVRVTELKPKDNLGPAAYVSIRPGFLRIFEEGGEISGGAKFLVVLLPEGRRLRFKRPGKRAGWAAIWAQNKNRLRLVPTKTGGWLVLCRVSKRLEVAVYLLTKNVKEKKRLNFGRNAAAAGQGMAEEIANLLEGRLSG